MTNHHGVGRDLDHTVQGTSRSAPDPSETFVPEIQAFCPPLSSQSEEAEVQTPRFRALDLRTEVSPHGSVCVPPFGQRRIQVGSRIANEILSVETRLERYLAI